MEWRFVPRSKNDPRLAVALEEVLLKKVSKTKTPVIRFWEWEDKAVTIGRSQKASNEVDLEHCRDENIDVIRRPSGGGAMYHTPGDELVYSIIAPKNYFPKDITVIYKKICSQISKILAEIDIDAYFVEPNSIFLSDRKISGNAQKITKDAVLQHGTILYSPNKKMMFSVLKDSHSIDKYISSNMNSVIGISEVSDISLKDLYQVLKYGLLDGKKHFTKIIEKDELTEAKELIDKKYGEESWNLSP
ncbi:MAG: lipoate--protein ligase family protein [Candidatus Saliniplasma sp.]